MVKQKAALIENAHADRISGILNLNDQIVLSSSFDGTIKVWIYDSSQGVISLDKANSDKFLSYYSTQNKTEIAFLDMS